MFIEHLLYAKSWSRGWNQVERTDPGSKTGARDTYRLCSSCLSLLMKRIGRKEYWRVVGNELCKGNQTHQSGKKVQE